MASPATMPAPWETVATPAAVWISTARNTPGNSRRRVADHWGAGSHAGSYGPGLKGLMAPGRGGRDSAVAPAGPVGWPTLAPVGWAVGSAVGSVATLAGSVATLAGSVAVLAGSVGSAAGSVA